MTTITKRPGALWNDPQVGCLYKIRPDYDSPESTPGDLILVVAVESFEDPHPVFDNMLPVWPKITILGDERVYEWCYITEECWHQVYERVK